MRLLTPDSMRKVDRAAVEEVGIPSLVLMENAAIGVADAIGESFPEARSAAILCGPGNNGGDGLALGRHLAIRGYQVELYLFSPGGDPRGDAGVQLAICRNQGLTIREIGREDDLHPVLERVGACDLVVDALFGTGLDRPLEGQFAEVASALGSLPAVRVAVDLPSGLKGGEAEIPGPHFEADLTVTFGAPKIAHVFPPASEASGEVVVADLGIPPELIEQAEGDLHLTDAAELAAGLLSRPTDSHKGDYGHVLVVGGSPGKSGAAILTARGAMRIGAGLVTAAVPASILNTVDLGSIESMSLGLEEDAGGGLAESAADRLLTAVEEMRAVALGPGLGTEPSTVALVRRVVAELSVPLVLDADGINAFAGAADELARRKNDTVITPHPGELARLMGAETSEIVADRLGWARRAAEVTGAVVVLKGFQTLVARRGAGVFVNPTGNPGMASGGAGDVLTGMIAGLIGQGYEALEAARLGVFLHGLAGDIAEEEVGQMALVAGDLLEALPEALELLSRA